MKALTVFICLTLMLLFVALPFTTFPNLSVKAQDLQEGTDIDNLQNQESIGQLPIPDFSSFSFADLGGATAGGTFSPADLDPDLADVPPVEWQEGERPENLLGLGDFSDISTIGNWSLSVIGQYVPEVQWAQIPLSALGLLKNQNFEDFVDAVPLLGTHRLRDVQPLQNFLASKMGWSSEVSRVFGGQSLENLANNPLFGGLNFEDYDFSSSFISDIPNLENATFSSFPGWENAKISEIPSLANVPIAKYIGEISEYLQKISEYVGYVQQALDYLTPIARVDTSFGRSEGNQAERSRASVTGSYQEGFNVPCNEDSCQYLELTDLIPYPLPLVHGKEWISGNSQKVWGGTRVLGALSRAAGIKEPTGRNPFGRFFKVVLLDVNESQGLGNFGIYFRACVRWPFNLGCSPYVIGPFPWFPSREGEPIILGIDFNDGDLDSGLGGVGSGTLPSEVRLLTKLAEQYPQLAEQVQQAISSTQATNYGSPGFPQDSLSTDDDCEIYRGVEMGALRQAIADIESRGGGDYYAVGQYVSGADGGRNSGHALGRYQYMSYRDDVRQVFHSQPGGRQILERSSQNSSSPAELRSAIGQYFPPAAQEKLRSRDWKNVINRQKAQGKNESQTVYSLACVHYSGNEGICGDRNNPTYASTALNNYQRYKAQRLAETKCNLARQTTGICKGRYAWPTRGLITSEFSGNRCLPGRECRAHLGIDVAYTQGTDVVASDGGVVHFVGNDSNGFGNYVILRHCNGDHTLYGHLSSINVRKDQSVTQGQTIGGQGTTGNSTGVHLHFEYRPKGGRGIDPRKVLPSANNKINI